MNGRLPLSIQKRILNFQNRQRNTPIHEAAASGSEEMIKALLETALIDESIKNSEDKTYEDLRVKPEPQPVPFEA